MMLEAEIALEQGQAGDALEKLEALKREAGAHTAAQRLSLRALGAAGRSAEIPPVVDQLVKRKVYDAAQGNLLRRARTPTRSRGSRSTRADCATYWNRLSEAERLQPKVALAAARSFTRLGGDREAADLLARSLEQEWDDELLLAWAECRPADATRQLETGGALAREPQPRRDAALRARPAVRARAALGQGADLLRGVDRARRPLARARDAGRDARAARPRRTRRTLHLAAALKLALAELGADGSGR